MHRRIARSIFILLCGAGATVIGVGAALLFTIPGRSLLVRLVSDQSYRVLRGSLRVGAVRGSWLEGFTLAQVEIRDTAGQLFLRAPRVRVQYDITNLLAGRFVFSELELERPELFIIKHRDRGDINGRTNLEEIFRLNEPARRTVRGPSRPPPLIEARNLTITDGQVVIWIPWNPDGRLRTRAQVDSALAAQRERPGRRIEEGREGLDLVRMLDRVNGTLPLLRLSSPDRQPVTAQIERLAMIVSDPPLEVRDLRGSLRTRGDSLLFQAERIELPGTRASGEGRLDWPQDTILYRMTLDAPRLALADLRWISPEFPDFTGSARVRGNSIAGSRTEWAIGNLTVGDATSRVTGRLVAIVDVYRGLGFRGLDVQLTTLDLDAVRPYLDTLPFHGWLSGPLRASGFFDSMTVDLDWEFRDAAVTQPAPDGQGPGGSALSRISLAGPLKMGGAEGLVFSGATLRSSDVDLRTVTVVAPAITLQGRLAAEGTLTGPLRNVTFDGTALHRDGERPASRLRGRVRLDNRGEVLGLETDVVLDSLVFAGLRGSWPALGTRGALGGPVKLTGTLDRLAVDLDVGGSLGLVRAIGGVTLRPPVWGADSLRVSFDRLDLSAFVADAPLTRLRGAFQATGRLAEGVAPAGTLALDLSRGTFGGFLLDTARVALHAADSLITADTIQVRWRDGRLDGGGSIGWAAPKSGRLAMHLEATQLTPFDSLARAATGWVPDSAAGDQPLAGHGRGDGVLEGSLPELRLEATLALDSVRWLGYRSKSLTGQFTWNRRAASLLATAAADSLWVRRLLFTGVLAEARGRGDSLGWAAALSARDLTRASAGGTFQRLPGEQLLTADSLNLDLLGRRWALENELRARITDQVIALDTVRLVTPDGAGRVQLAGRIPREGPGEVAVRALGVELRDVYALAQRDTTGITGYVAADARLAGTARAPEIRGTASVTGGTFGDFHAPEMRTAFDYRDRRLQASLTLWRTGKPVVEANATLPLDLSLTKVPSRRLPGPIDLAGRGDSVDLAIIEAFTPNLRQVGGLLDIDARIEGTWEAPRMAGWVRVRDGAATVPGLGVRYDRIVGIVRLAGDSVLSDGLQVGGGLGTLGIGGGIRLTQLTEPALDLALTADQFDVMAIPGFMALRATGEFRLSGTLLRPVLSGQGRIDNSVIYFADLVQKEIVNLEDPLFADLIDTLALRRYRLGAPFQSRFLDSLTIRNFDATIGESVWLRSNEANFQLEGSVLVNKSPYRGGVQPVYRVVGNLNVPRGTYTLKAGGVITRTFTVEQGTVHYFGDPREAELDVEAQHIVRSPGSDNIPVIAHITGTLAVPDLRLRTPPDRPPLSEDQLISLLTVGATDPLAVGAVEQQAWAAAANALAAELQRSLLTERSAIDIIEIRPPVATGRQGGLGAGPAQIGVGKALTEKLFITANAGFCLGRGQALSARNVGATLEYRFRPELRGQLSAEPVQTCLPRGVDIFGVPRRYQFGAELRWNRDF